MKHFLITRFNLRAAHWQTSKTGNPVLTEDWLKKRFFLFETYCLPSVVNQTQQNFTWLVFFDTHTPTEYRRRAIQISKEYPNFFPVFIDGIESLKDSSIEEIKKEITPSDDYIITSRLDNDDIIHKNYIKTIQCLFQPLDKTVIDLRIGYQATLGEPYSQIRNVYNIFNPYISLIESVDNFKTVFHRQHKDWKNSNSVIIYEDQRLWCEVVHHENVLNSTRKFAVRTYSLNAEDFGQKKGFELTDSPINVFISNNQLYIRRFLSKIKNGIVLKIPTVFKY
ncbi:putative rhamnosyl transferase [Gramella jeungdoensis]|uniref:Rhamnosyl transferase n=1 Tax=Gramella jeungdoensis TaxID=708091 RepID=A0ABT0Z427_9FLAO|nr:glycosyltransferase [Gramella jeungdoensis]MCM8570484.1 putative rhamnosyl transferase [Gramella jeungdoensis]